MNQSTMKKLFTVVAALSFALSVAACGSGGSNQAKENPPLAGASIKGDFALLDKTGKTVRWNDFDGRYRIVYFGYAYCPDVCPLDVQTLVKGLALFAKTKPELAGDIQPIFITIDPERDTPQVVGEFTSAFSSRLIGLTGTPEQIKQAAKGFAAYYAKGETDPGGGYLMDHSRAAYLMGRKGEPIALLPVDKDPQAVAAELEKWVS
jgi:protein SCO1/2